MRQRFRTAVRWRPENQCRCFKHSDSSPFWISGQANVIFQAHPAFHTAYSGTNSLSNAGEYKASLLGTLFLGVQVPHTRKHTEFLLDFESAGGRGISQALGLAGFTNLDVVRNPNLGDGNLNYGRENILETYYNLHAWRGLFYSVGVSYISNPGYDRDRGLVIVQKSNN